MKNQASRVTGSEASSRASSSSSTKRRAWLSMSAASRGKSSGSTCRRMAGMRTPGRRRRNDSRPRSSSRRWRRPGRRRWRAARASSRLVSGRPVDCRQRDLEHAQVDQQLPAVVHEMVQEEASHDEGTWGREEFLPSAGQAPPLEERGIGGRRERARVRLARGVEGGEQRVAALVGSMVPGGVGDIVAGRLDQVTGVAEDVQEMSGELPQRSRSRVRPPVRLIGRRSSTRRVRATSRTSSSRSAAAADHMPPLTLSPGDLDPAAQEPRVGAGRIDLRRHEPAARVDGDVVHGAAGGERELARVRRRAGRVSRRIDRCGCGATRRKIPRAGGA